MSAVVNQFLDKIEREGMVPKVHVDYLRQQIHEAGRDFPLHMIARKLVQSGYLTSFHAKNLVAEVLAQAKGTLAPQDRQHADSDKRLSEIMAAPHGTVSGDDELELAPLDEASAAPAKAEAPRRPGEKQKKPGSVIGQKGERPHAVVDAKSLGLEIRKGPQVSDLFQQPIGSPSRMLAPVELEPPEKPGIPPLVLLSMIVGGVALLVIAVLIAIRMMS